MGETLKNNLQNLRPLRPAALDFYPALMQNIQDPPSLRYVQQGFAPNNFTGTSN